MATQLPSLADALLNAMTASQAEAAAITSAAQQAQQGLSRTKQLQDIISNADVTISEIRNRQTQDVETRKQQIYDQAHGAGRQQYNMDNVIQANEVVRSLANELQQKANRPIGSMLQDPIGAIGDWLTIDQTRQDLQDAILSAKVQQEIAVSEYTRMTQDFQVAEELKKTVDDAIIAADATKLNAQREAAQIKLDQEIATQGLKPAQAVASMTKDVVTLANTRDQAARAAEAARMERARFELAKRAEARQAQEDEARAKARAEDKAMADTLVGWMRRGAQAEGVDLGDDPASLKLMVARSAQQGTPEARWVDLGRRNAAVGPNSQILAATPAAGLAVVSDDRIKLPPSLDAASKFLKDMETKFLYNKKLQTEIGKDPKKAEKLFNLETQNELEFQFQNVRPGSVADFTPVIPSLITKDPELSKLPVVQKFLLPHQQVGGKFAMSTDLLKAAAESIKAGKLTSAEFVDGMSQIYGKSALYYTRASRFGDLGLDVPLDGRTYNVDIGQGDGPRNFTQPAEIQRALAWQIAPPFGLSRGFIDSLSPFTGVDAAQLTPPGMPQTPKAPKPTRQGPVSGKVTPPGTYNIHIPLPGTSGKVN